MGNTPNYLLGARLILICLEEKLVLIPLSFAKSRTKSKVIDRKVELIYSIYTALALGMKREHP